MIKREGWLWVIVVSAVAWGAVVAVVLAVLEDVASW